MSLERNRELKKAVRQAEAELFLARMPVGLESALKLFDQVDQALQADACHDDLRHTLAACGGLGLRSDAVLPWLRDHGGGCDCEVVANVGERVEETGRGVRGVHYPAGKTG